MDSFQHLKYGHCSQKGYLLMDKHSLVCLYIHKLGITMDRASLCKFSLMGDVAVTSKIIQRLAILFDKDPSTERNLIQLSSRPEFGLHLGDKGQIRKDLKDDQYWAAGEKFLVSWVSHKASSATFEVLLEALDAMEWKTLDESIVNSNWSEIEGMRNMEQEALQELR